MAHCARTAASSAACICGSLYHCGTGRLAAGARSASAAGEGAGAGATPSTLTLPGGGSCRSLRPTAALLPPLAALSKRRRPVLSDEGCHSRTHCPTWMPLVLDTCAAAAYPGMLGVQRWPRASSNHVQQQTHASQAGGRVLQQQGKQQTHPHTVFAAVCIPGDVRQLVLHRPAVTTLANNAAAGSRRGDLSSTIGSKHDTA